MFGVELDLALYEASDFREQSSALSWSPFAVEEKHRRAILVPHDRLGPGLPETKTCVAVAACRLT